MKRLFYISITLAIASGLSISALEALSGLIPWFVAGMLFFNFLDAEIAVTRLFRKELLVTSLLTALVMPLVTHHLLSVPFDAPYRIGLLLVACAPSGVMGMILIRYLPNRDFNLAFSNFLISNFGSILVIPLVLKLFAEQTAVIRIRPVLMQTAALILIPYFATRLLNRLGTAASHKKLRTLSNFLMPIFVFMIVATSLAGASDELRWNVMLLGMSGIVFVIYLLQGGLGYLAGLLLGKRDVSNTLALIGSSRNCQIILAVAILNFSPLAAVPIIIATIFHHLTNALWLWALQRW